MNFHTNKGTGRNKNTKRLLLEIETGLSLYSLDGYKYKITRKRQKDEHDQSSVKFPPKSTLGFILVKENWKKRQSKMNQAKILLRCIWCQNC